MGSVIDNCECPKCNYEYATMDYYYKSGEEHMMCDRCGYYRDVTIKDRDSDEHEYVIREIDEPIGFYKIKNKVEGLATSVGCIENEEHYSELIHVLENDKGVKDITISQYKDGTYLTRSLKRELILRKL